MKKIVKGNDFTLKIPVMKSVEGQKVPFPLPACTDVQVRVCNQFKRISLSYEVDVENDNVILARVEGDQIPLGTYAIEVRGKILGNDWRSEEYPQFEIVARNADADLEFGETDEGDNSVEMDTALVILPPSVDLQNLITKAEEAIADTKKAIEDVKDASSSIDGSEAERAKAEKVREDNESARAKAEKLRADAELDRVSNESQRKKCEDARNSAEDTRLKAEIERNSRETHRVSDERERVSNESARKSAEIIRISNEEARGSSESNRVKAEAARSKAEKERVGEEDVRVESEKKRVNTEQLRVDAEGKRVLAEEARVLAEKKREIDFSDAKSECETAADNANTATGNTNEAIRKCEVATAGAEKVNANLTDDNVVEITDRTGTTKSVSLDEAVKVGNDVTRIKQTLGAYSDREDIVLTPKETNKAISSDGVKVTKQGWAIAEFTAEKGNEYLFKPNVIDGSVCVFAEYITSIETRGIDYTYTYNEDGTIATATATYLGNTHTYTYEWTVEAGVNTPTIKEGDTVINNLPMTYETKVGTYSPLVKLNDDAELPVDGYCRYMSHFKGNSSIKIVVSYKVGTADLTMKVLRDGVLASISTQLGNLSQKEDETRKKVEEYHGSYAEFMFNDDTRIIVDGKNIIIAARVKTRVYPKKSLVVGDRYSKKTLIYADVANLDTSGFTTFNAMFANCNILSELNLSAWDTSQVTSMASMFSGCSSLTSLNLSAWDTTSLGKGVKESVSDTGIYMMFFGSYNIKTLDMGGDGWNFVNIPSSNSFYRSLESSALTEWKLGKNFFKGRFVNQYYNSNAFNNWTKASFIESIVTNSYDRRANGYEDVTLYFSAKLKGYLSEENIATMTAKGYIIA